MPDRILHEPRLSLVEAAHAEAIHAELAAAAGNSKILASAEYVGPVSIEEYQASLRDDKETPLVAQLREALLGCRHGLATVSAETGVSPAILKRFINGHSSLTLNSAGKLAAFLNLTLQLAPPGNGAPQSS